MYYKTVEKKATRTILKASHKYKNILTIVNPDALKEWKKMLAKFYGDVGFASPKWSVNILILI